MKKTLPSFCILIFALLSLQTAQAQCNAIGTNTAGANGNSTAIGSINWINTGNTAAADGAYTTAASLISTGLIPISTTTNYLSLSNFGFAVPGTYTICGVGISIVRGYISLLSLNGSVVDNTVQLATISGSTPTLIGLNQALTAVHWPYATPVTATYGGAGILMGVSAATMTPAMVNNSNFGVAIAADVITAPLQVSIGMTAAIDQVSLTVYTTPPSTLPILLENFTVSGGAAGNLVSWTAGTNNVANAFEVQRSSDGNNWQDLTTMTATAGNTGSYNYTDADAPSGTNYYRLKLVNDDGTTGYSIIAIVATRIQPNIHFYPNPFHDMINISATTPFHHVSLTDIAGRTLWVKEYASGINSVQIPSAALPQGLYFVSVDGSTSKLVKN
jgi:Secretion system C-terminal sorting domain